MFFFKLREHRVRLVKCSSYTAGKDTPGIQSRPRIYPFPHGAPKSWPSQCLKCCTVNFSNSLLFYNSALFIFSLISEFSWTSDIAIEPCLLSWHPRLNYTLDLSSFLFTFQSPPLIKVLSFCFFIPYLLKKSKGERKTTKGKKRMKERSKGRREGGK